MTRLSMRLWMGCLFLGGALIFLLSSARAEPLRIALHAQVFAPDRPTLTFIADQPVSNLSLALEPTAREGGVVSAESAPLQFKEKRLAAGKQVVYRLGTGKLGATAWRGIIECYAEGKLWKKEVNLSTKVMRKLEIRFDPNYHSSHLSIDNHYVEVQLSAPASRGEIHVFADDGSAIGSGSASFSNPPPNTWLRLAWPGQGPQKTDSVVLRLAISLMDSEGNSAQIDLYPWSVSVPHQEVNFATGSAEIDDSERSKLDESLNKIKMVLNRVETTLASFAERGIVSNPPTPKLYVSGHTDTVGSDSENLTLSRNRARAIATYFHQHGFLLPVFFTGFGERQPRVKTADNVDELRNRRADYTLAIEALPLLSGLSWQKL